MQEWLEFWGNFGGRGNKSLWQLKKAVSSFYFSNDWGTLGVWSIMCISNDLDTSWVIWLKQAGQSVLDWMQVVRANHENISVSRKFVSAKSLWTIRTASNQSVKISIQTKSYVKFRTRACGWSQSAHLGLGKALCLKCGKRRRTQKTLSHSFLADKHWAFIVIRGRVFQESKEISG